MLNIENKKTKSFKPQFLYSYFKIILWKSGDVSHIRVLMFLILEDSKLKLK